MKRIFKRETGRPDSMEQATREIKFIRYEPEVLLATTVGLILYARYSTDNQAHTSTEDQLRRTRRSVSLGDVRSVLFSQAKIELRHEFKDDAVSGFGTVGRDGLDQALSKIRNGEAKIILVDDFKRFVRGMGSALDLYDFLQDHGAELISISDSFSSAEPNARLKFMNKAYASEEFLDGVSRDTQRGLNERRYEGFSDGHLCFGIGSKATRTIHMKGREKDSHFDYFVIPHLAQIVLRVFSMANDGLSNKAIAYRLNEDGISPPQCWDKKTGILKQAKAQAAWKDKTVWNILNNKSYIGIIERGKTKIVRRNDGTKKVIAVPKEKWLVIERPDLRIVPLDLWNSVREKLQKYHIEKDRSGVESNRPFKYDGTTNKLLTGICKCHKCGTGFVQVSGKHGGRYGCPTYRKSRACDNKKTVSWRKLEGTVIRWILEQVKSEEIFTILASKYNKLLQERLSGESAEWQAKELQLSHVDEAIKNILANMERGLVSPALSSRLSDLEFQKQKLKEQIRHLEGLNKSQLLMTPRAIQQRFNEIPSLIREKTPQEVNRALKSLFRGQNEIVLVPRIEHGIEDYWALGKLNIGRLMGIGAKLTGEYGNPETLDLDVPFELKIGTEETG